MATNTKNIETTIFDEKINQVNERIAILHKAKAKLEQENMFLDINDHEDRNELITNNNEIRDIEKEEKQLSQELLDLKGMAGR